MLKVVFEDADILIVNKPWGLVVNRSETVKGETLQDLVTDYLKLNGLGIGGRAGIVHRLDRDTSGLLIIAKREKIFYALQEQFKDRKIEKKYAALVHGNLINNEGSINLDITRIGKFGKFGIAKRDDRNVRSAETIYKINKKYELKGEVFSRIIEKIGATKPKVKYFRAQAMGYSLLWVYPKTGRTHQIRVHLKSIGHPIVSDSIYTPNKLLTFDLEFCPRLFLHAAGISFFHPTRKKVLSFRSVLPNELKSAILNFKPILRK